MPTNYQARIKMTQKIQASNSARDVVALAPTTSSKADANSNAGSQSLPPKRAYPLGEAKNAPRFLPTRSDRVREFSYGFSKRAFDLTVGSILLIIATPIILAAAAAIRINTPGSPFFFQNRVGKNGELFRIFKLRGMYIDARVRFPTYYDFSKKRDLEFCFHHEDDPRVTPAGKFIRRTSIDELPNLWNVVVGTMSLVGPRPEIPDVIALYGRYKDEYLSVKPGVTCLSKCTGRDTLTKRETIEFDLDYIRRRSLALDFKILWKTFRGVILRRDVF